MKRSVYFLGKYKSGQLICQASEIADAEFLPLDSSLERLSFEDTKNVLKEADVYLNNVIT